MNLKDYMFVTDTGAQFTGFLKAPAGPGGKNKSAFFACHSSSHLPINEPLSAHSKLAHSDACERSAEGSWAAAGSSKEEKKGKRVGSANRTLPPLLLKLHRLLSEDTREEEQGVSF